MRVHSKHSVFIACHNWTFQFNFGPLRVCLLGGTVRCYWPVLNGHLCWTRNVNKITRYYNFPRVQICLCVMQLGHFLLKKVIGPEHTKRGKTLFCTHGQQRHTWHVFCTWHEQKETLERWTSITKNEGPSLKQLRFQILISGSSLVSPTFFNPQKERMERKKIPL